MTKREKEVYGLMKKGMRNSEIAEKLQISVNTVKIHVKNVLKHYACKDRLELLFKKKS